MKTPPDPSAVVREYLELLGGHEEAFAFFHKEFEITNAAWNQDTAAIGRILRGHLFVEHFLTQYLSSRNPELGSLQKARLSFSQKVALVGKGTPAVSYLLPGVKRLNAIRNRLAHSLRADVTAEDAAVFLAIPLFLAMLKAKHDPRPPSTDPLDVLEEFAMHAGLMFQASVMPIAGLFSEAIRRAEVTHAAAENSPRKLVSNGD